MKVLDPVCGMRFEVDEAAGQSEYGGRTYYFCGEGCKDAFDHDPERFLEEGSDEGPKELY
ncbi:MAG: YHS domain-containing protein [Gemmatimonadales bacterium]|nr:YHS domain-containing protein [Gemmatimonadales bacterium]